MKVKRFLPVLLLFALLFQSVTVALAQDDPVGETGDAATGQLFLPLLGQNERAIQPSDRAVTQLTTEEISKAEATGASTSEFTRVSLIVTFEDSVSTPVVELPDTQIIHRYQKVFNGVSLVTSQANIEAIANLPGVTGVYIDQLQQLNTEVSPQFIGAPTVWELLGGQGSAGEGVVVGILDSGIWPEHPSLSDPDPAGKPYAAPEIVPGANGFGSGGPRNTCDFGNDVFNPADADFTCNNKLIGAYAFIDTYKVLVGLLPAEFDSARDDNGHGTHTATTAAGNGGVAAEIFDIDRGIISGVAPRAQVIAYRVCGDEGCYQSDSVAAIEQAILDGVDVINFSIGGGNSPYSDPVELAFLDAYESGVFVAASAGNSGPTPDTVSHRGPWVTTVAASTSNRHFLSTLTLTADNGDTLTLTGATVTEGISTPTPVVLSSDPSCALPSGALAGVIAICDRVGARLQVGFNAFQAGAAGMILRNVTPAQLDILTDNHFLPSVHISLADGAALQTFMQSHTGVTATFTQGESQGVLGDRIAGFSSRGGSGQTLGVNKPDVTAPGVQILAGTTPLGATPLSGRPGELFQSIQGTSMSSPHVAGAAALLKALHPEWTPGQIKSALMTTAKTEGVVKEDGVTPTTPFDDGAGRIDLTVAGDPGLTIDETAANYLAFQDALWNANYPSIYHPDFPGAITLQRTLQSLLPNDSVWEAETTAGDDWGIFAPSNIRIPANGTATLNIHIDARYVPVGEVRHGEIRLHHGNYRLHIPVTIVRGEADVTLSKRCVPRVLAKRRVSTCAIIATNNSFTDSNVRIVDTLPRLFNIIPRTLTGATMVAPDRIEFAGTLAGAEPPDVTIAPGDSPAGGYLPLSSLDVPPIPGVGDDTITNFNVPAFSYAGESWTSLGVSSNGYLVVGGGSGQDNTIDNQSFPDPNPPNNVLAAFWTDLNPSVTGAVRIEVLTDGVDEWIVVDWEGVREFSAPNLASFQIWIGVSGDTTPDEDISYAYGPIQGNGDGGFLTVGAENRYGNRGGTVYFDGTGTLPEEGTQLRVTTGPSAPGASHVIIFQMRSHRSGLWQNCAEMTADTFQGAAISCLFGIVR